MALRYVRVVIAVQSNNLLDAVHALDDFIEDCDSIEGCNVAKSTADKEKALGEDWQDLR